MEYLTYFFSCVVSGWLLIGLPPSALRAGEARTNLLLFTTDGRTASIRPEGGEPRYFEFDVPGQATWQPGPGLSDGQRLVFLSMEPRRDGPGRPFDKFYTQTPTHIWLHDLRDGTLTELCTRDRLAPFMTPALLVSDERMLVQVVQEGVGRIVSMKLDGSEARDFTRPGEGLPYGLSLSPDGRRVAFHLASPEGYQVWTSDVDGGSRVKLAADPAHLFFGTSWSPDGEWVLFVDCLYQQDPGHDWCDVMISRADGSEQKRLTERQAMWFAATYGPADRKGGGSNLPAWTSDGAILYPRRLPGSRVPWQYQVDQADTDHFNRAFRPEQARGGSEIWRLDPASGKATRLTHNEPAVWDFRATQSADGAWIAFCRAETGGSPRLWVMRSDGSEAQELSAGHEGHGADHPRWLPERRVK